MDQLLVEDREHARADHRAEEGAEAAERDEHENAHVHAVEV